MRLSAVLLTLLSINSTLVAKPLDERLPVHGLVIDRYTHEGISDATVVLISHTSEEMIKTDSSGYFVLYILKCNAFNINVYCTNYESESLNNIEISSCTPFIRIEMNSSNSRFKENRIKRLIELSEYTYFEQGKTTNDFYEEVRQMINKGRRPGYGSKTIMAKPQKDYLTFRTKKKDEMTKPVETEICSEREVYHEMNFKRDRRSTSNRIRTNKKNYS